MRRLRYTAVLAAAALASAALTAGTTAASAGTAGAPVGEAPALPPGAAVAGPEAGSAALHITVALRPADPAGLNALATQVSTPGSPQFRHFLSPAQVQDRFGPPGGAAAAVTSWLRSQHLSTGSALGDGLLIPATGSTAQVEAAFQTTIDQVRLANGRMARVNRQAPKVPARLRRWVTAVAGLDNLNTPRPGLAQGAAAGPQACPAARKTPHVYTAAQLARAYGFTPLYRGGDFGQHITIALFELADYATSDIGTYKRCYGIHPAVRRVPVDGGTTIKASGQGIGEVTADIEVAGVMAPRARILVYEAPASGGDASSLDNYGTIVQQNRAQVVSSSWGNCEPVISTRVLTVESQLFQEMAVQGQSMMAAAGDAGLRSLPAVPAADTAPPGLPPGGQRPGQPAVRDQRRGHRHHPLRLAAGGVGVEPDPGRSRLPGPVPRPTRPQAEVPGEPGRRRRPLAPVADAGLAARVRSQRQRQRRSLRSARRHGLPGGARCLGPGSAGTKHLRGYVIYGAAGAFKGAGWQTAGGTSLATPLWAALTALADHQMVTHRLGLLSPSLYRIDQQDPQAFTDVAAGENDYLAASGNPSHYTCQYQAMSRQPCYRAVTGYDTATGLGTPQAAFLVADLLR